LLAGFSFLFLFSFFWLCATLMPWLVIDIMLLQRLDVIGMFLILIYYLYQKKSWFVMCLIIIPSLLILAMY
jgi:hypothetical protein